MDVRGQANEKSYFNALTTLYSQHDGDTTVLSHAAIALYVEHHIPQNDRWYVLGGSEDLRALLSKVEMSDDNNELFILIRPYIHSMGLYLRYESGQIKAFIFDSQNWGTRYYPTRLIIEAIQKHYPAADILLSGTVLQHQNDQRGCIQYALMFLEWAAGMDSDSPLRNGQRLFITYAENKRLLDGYPHVFQQENNQLPASLLHCGMSHDPKWYVKKRQEQIEAVNKSLKEAYLRNDGTHFWEKIFKIVEKRQGVGLSFIRRPMQSTMYDIKLDENKLTIIFKTNDMVLYGNLLQFSQAIDPISVTTQNSQWLLSSDKIRAHYNPATLTLTYAYQSIETLQSLVEALQQPANVEALYWNNMRQLAGLEELCHEIMLKIELRKIMQDKSGGFYQGTTLSALAALFEAEKTVYVPSCDLLVGDNASLSIEGLSSQGYRFIAFPFQANLEHQVAAWVDIKKKQVRIIDPLSKNQLLSQSLSYLETLLGIQRSTFTYQNPIETQRDDWSCGVHVVRNLLAAYGCETAIPTLAERAECYLRAAHHYDKKSQKQHRINQANEQSLRQLLLLVESFRYQQGYFQSGSVSNNNDTFKVLADYLQNIVWGNTDRQATPENNAGRKNESQSLLLTQSLRDLSAQYANSHKTDKHGLFILKLACILVENNENLNDMLPAVLEKMSIVKPIGMDEKLYFRQNKKYKDALALLTSEVGMSCKGKPPVYLFNLARACLQARKSITDNSEFLNVFLLIVTDDKEQADSYHVYIGPLIVSDSDSFLYDFLAFLATQYLSMNESQKNMLKSYQAERLAFFENREREKKAITDLLEQMGVSYEINNSNMLKLRSHLPRLQEMIKKGCLVNYTNDEMVYFLDKLISLKFDTSDIEKLFTLYLGKNTDAWEVLMIEAINNMPPIVIANTKVDGISILARAEDLKLIVVTNRIILISGSHLLDNAVKSGNLHDLEILIKYNVNVNAFESGCSWGALLMIRAISSGNAAVVELLLAAGADPNNHGGHAPLLEAAHQGHAAIVNLLLAAGADQHIAHHQRGTPLIMAAEKGYIDIVEIMLAAGVEVDAATDSGETALIIAAVYGHTETVERLLAAGANPNAVRRSTGNSVLITAAIYCHTIIVKALLAAGANIDDVNDDGFTAFMAARDMATIRVLFERLLLDKLGMAIEVEDHIIPIVKSHSILIQYMINHGCLKGYNSDEIKMLLDGLANLKPGTGDLHALLTLYPGNNRSEWETLIMQTMKNYPPDNISRLKLKIDGVSILTYARKFQFTLWQDYIIKMAGLYLLKAAIESDNLEEIQLLISKGIDINASIDPYTGTTPLMLAVIYSNIPAVERLLAAGANPNARDKSYLTALHYAQRHECTNIAKMLLDQILSELFGVAVEVEEVNNARVHDHLLSIRGLLKLGCLKDYTVDDIKCFLDKLVHIDPMTKHLEKLLILYSGKNKTVWEALMIEYIEILSFIEIMDKKFNGLSMLDYAEKFELNLMVDVVRKKMTKHIVIKCIIDDDLHMLEMHSQSIAVCDGSFVEAVKCLSCVDRDPVFIEVLLARGFNINDTDSDGFTALHVAALLRKTTLVNFLLSVPGININAVDEDGYTPLFHAIDNKDIALVKSLIDAGANLNIVLPHTQETVLTWLEKNGGGDFVNKFRQANVTSHHADEVKSTKQSDTINTGIYSATAFWRAQDQKERQYKELSPVNQHVRRLM